MSDDKDLRLLAALDDEGKDSAVIDDGPRYGQLLAALDDQGKDSIASIPPMKPPMDDDDSTPGGSIRETVQVPQRVPNALTADQGQIPFLSAGRGPVGTTPGTPPQAALSTPAPASSVADYIGNRLNKSQSDLKAAQQESARQRGIATLAEGIGQISSGMAHSDSFNPADYKSLHQNAETPVNDYVEAQKAKSGALGELTAEKKFNQMSLYDDPNSVPSKIAQNLTSKMLSKQGLDPNSIQGMSAADLNELQKTLKDVNDRDSMEKIIKLKQQQVKLATDEKRDTKNQQDELAQLTKLQGNKTYQTFRDQAARADGLLSTIDQARTNPAAANALTTELGTYISGGQKLHNKTMEDMGGGEKDIIGKLSQISQRARTGTITQGNADYLKKFITAQNADARVGQQKMEKDTADSYRKVTGRTPRWYTPGETPQVSKYSPGDVVSYQGKKFRVGADGDTLEDL